MARRALVVDDDRSMVKTLSDVLALKGWQVRAAYSGATAVAATDQEHFDVVLMDVRMPGLDGIDAFRAMKRTRPDLPVVLMTAYTAPERLAEAEKEGVIRVLSKPVNIPALLAILADRFNGHQPVLVIDRDAAFLRTLSEVLSVRGYDVVPAGDLAHATRLMAGRRPIAVLLHLPGTGHVREVVAAIHEVNPHAAVILYSGQPNAAQEVARDLPSDWVHAYLQKPFAIEQVAGVLDALRHG